MAACSDGESHRDEDEPFGLSDAAADAIGGGRDVDEEHEEAGKTAEDAGDDASSDAADATESAQDADAGEIPDSASADSGDSQADPCLGVTSAGRCVDPQTVERCADGPGGAALVRHSCKLGAMCDNSGAQATCVLSGSCTAPDAVCVDTHTLATCTAGVYQHTRCPRACVQSALGSVCALDLETRAFTGQLKFELRRPNAGLTDWATVPEVVPGRGMLVLSYRGMDLLDAVVTSSAQSDAGTFSIQVPSSPGPDDSLVVMAAGANARGRLAFVVADPGFGASDTLRSAADVAPNPRVWSWRYALSAASDAAPLVITEAAGSAAAFVFEAVRNVFSLGQRFYAPLRSQSVIAWLGIGTAWQCGACTHLRAITAFDTEFLHQLRIDGSTDQGYWADSVTYHELGHYLMNAFGLSAREGGVRYFGELTNPGLAWQEGWATFSGAVDRGSSIYYDKQLGGFFWFDIDARHYAFDNLVWQRPSATHAAGLNQMMDENEIASMLWKSFQSVGKREPYLAALASPRVTVGPFERGYTRRTWTDPDHPELYTDTGISVSHLPDFLDALRCAGSISSVQLDPVTEPVVHYPYPSESPLCR